MKWRSIGSFAVCSVASCVGGLAPEAPPYKKGARAWAEVCEYWDDWDKPAPPFHITRRTSYVGTCGITSLLVETDDGLVLFDSGTEAGAEVALSNVVALGHNPMDVAFVLVSHEHHDHVGGLARLIEATGAEVVASREAVSVLRTGELDPRDPQAGTHDAMRPVAVRRAVENDGIVSLGGVEFRMTATPGHTPGATSWSWRECADDGTPCRNIVYGDSLSPVSREGYRFSDHPDYVAAYRAGLDALAALPCDILLTPHPSASRMIRRAAAGDFVEAAACETYADGIRARLDTRLAQEADGEP